MPCGRGGTASETGNLDFGPLLGPEPCLPNLATSGFLRVIPPPPEFDRGELQDIRDIATERAQTIIRSCAERDALEALARNADILDALYAREDEELEYGGCDGRLGQST